MQYATEEESWFLETSQKLVQTDIYAARSWLLTAKSIFPQSFKLQIEEYLLELNKKNTEECSKLLNEIFREFPSEPALWEEIEKLIESVEHSNDPLRKAVFEGLPALTQQRMILASADSRVNIAQYCRLCIVLMKKFSETVSQYGLELVDKLVEAEKKAPEGTPVNHFRKLLVRDVLPVMCSSGNITVSHKHFYKWLQKSTEFYVCYFTSVNDSSTETAWSDLEALRSKIAGHCSWNEEDIANRKSLTDRMSLMRELFRRSRTDVDGAVNRKQVFYTCLILLFEASSLYVAHLCPSIYRATVGKAEDSFVLFVDLVDNADDAPDHLPQRRASDLNETFQVAKEAWSILHANETFDKDFNHLLRRWKCDRWFWFQLFLADLHLHSDDLESALVRLRQVEQRLENDPPRFEVKAQIYTHLAFISFTLGLYKESCQYVFECVSLLREPDSTSQQCARNCAINLNKLPFVPRFLSPLSLPPSSGNRQTLVMAKVEIGSLLPFWISILIRSLLKIAPPAVDDSVLSHLVVLSQHNWPTWRKQCSDVMKRIEENKSFSFESFSQFVINIDILEELAFLKNNKSCRIVLTSNPNAAVHVTRGANEKAEEDFWKTITAGVQRSHGNVDDLLVNYLMAHKSELMTSLEHVEAG